MQCADTTTGYRKKIRISLSQPSTTINANTGVEVNGKKLDNSVAKNDANAKGILSIIEVDLHGKATQIER